MIKKILVSIIIFSLFMLICGCTSNDNNSLVGKWISSDDPESDDIITFTSDGKYKLYDSIDTIEPKFEMKYELLDNNEIRLYDDDIDSVYMYYEFLDDGNLELGMKEGNVFSILERVE